ncbi:MAG: hypothetical protein AAGH42_08685 [Pseudomonadota bacterium]
MSLSEYYRTIAEFDAKRAKLRSSNLAALYRQQSINRNLIAEERQGLEQAGAKIRYRRCYSNMVRFPSTCFTCLSAFADGHCTTSNRTAPSDKIEASTAVAQQKISPVD